MKKNKKHLQKAPGICKLTGRLGYFVDSHLIPLALTRLSNTGEKVIEAEIGMPQRRRFQGWYDNQLCIRKGEDILSAIDDAGIKELRRHQLIWNSFESMDEFPDWAKIPERTVRLIDAGDANALRLFFVSLAWRAAATSRVEFAPIALDPSIVEDLRQKILAGDPGALSEYPVHLFQLRTKGPRHNRGPLLEQKEVMDSDSQLVGKVDYIRFHFEGLTAHVMVSPGFSYPSGYDAMFLGQSPHSIVVTHTFEESREFNNIQTLINRTKL